MNAKKCAEGPQKTLRHKVYVEADGVRFEK